MSTQTKVYLCLISNNQNELNPQYLAWETSKKPNYSSIKYLYQNLFCPGHLPNSIYYCSQNNRSIIKRSSSDKHFFYKT